MKLKRFENFINEKLEQKDLIHGGLYTVYDSESKEWVVGCKNSGYTIVQKMTPLLIFIAYGAPGEKPYEYYVDPSDISEYVRYIGDGGKVSNEDRLKIGEEYEVFEPGLAEWYQLHYAGKKKREWSVGVIQFETPLEYDGETYLDVDPEEIDKYVRDDFGGQNRAIKKYDL
jgi:hypothetical protein